MTKSQHFFVLDLTKLGAAYQIINAFVDDEVVKTFEISPCGSQAVLILVSSDLISLRIIEKECLSFFKMDILKSAFLENCDEAIISCYLSQNSSTIQKHLAIIESNFFSDSFLMAQKVIQNDFQMVDFRVVRTSPPSISMTVSSESLLGLSDISTWNFVFKLSIIDTVTKPLRSYFEILK